MAFKKSPRWLQAARAADRSPSKGGELDWLSRSLARAGVFPLAQAERAIADGRVKVNGRAATQPLMALRSADVVSVDGRRVDLSARTRVLMFHKPAGLVVGGSDPEGKGTVFEALVHVLPSALQSFGWHAVGRLDRNTTGLLLFTNDERFVRHATSPTSHLPKTYVAEVGSDATEKKLAPLREGIELDDGLARPAKAQVLGQRTVELILTEGRHHQVKRMLAAVGLPVLALHRKAIGELVLDVGLGKVRELTEAEVEGALAFRTSGP